MRTRYEIHGDFISTDKDIPKHQMAYLLEVLLDIRDLLQTKVN